MTAAQIIAEFEKYVDDLTELSSAEELVLCNKIYQEICDDRIWEFTKKAATGMMASTTTITVPSDFSGQFSENVNMTDNSDSNEMNGRAAGILINGVKWLRIINWSDRAAYANQDGYAYFDVANNSIVTCYAQPSNATYGFDYKFVPPDLALNDSPIFPARYHAMIYHKMATENFIINLFDKARSTGPDNAALANGFFQRMCLWNANLLSN